MSAAASLKVDWLVNGLGTERARSRNHRALPVPTSDNGIFMVKSRRDHLLGQAACYHYSLEIAMCKRHGPQEHDTLQQASWPQCHTGMAKMNKNGLSRKKVMQENDDVVLSLAIVHTVRADTDDH